MTVKELWADKMSRIAAAEGYEYRDIRPPRPTVADVERCRKLCEENLCGCYDSNWGCPPGSGSMGECRRALSIFGKAAVIYRRYDVRHDDKPTLKHISNDHQNLLREFNNLLRKEGYLSMVLADGGCNYCLKCTYPNQKCPFPDQKVCSVSGYGIMLMEYLEQFDIPFRFEDGAVTLHGLILYNEPIADPKL